MVSVRQRPVARKIRTMRVRGVHGRFCFSCKPPEEPARAAGYRRAIPHRAGVGRMAIPRASSKLACALAGAQFAEIATQHHPTGGCDICSTPVAVDTNSWQFPNSAQPALAEKCPPCRNQACNIQRIAAHIAATLKSTPDPWMSKQLTERQDGPLPWRILGRI